ncbi:MAG: recombinase family protein [Candidatus Sulfotelmatobacter sp.]
MWNFKRVSYPVFGSAEDGATGDAMGRLFVTIISAIAELERSLVAERVKSGMRRAKLEGKVIGRARLDVDREQVIEDRRSGMSLTLVARKHSISRASVCRLMKEANQPALAAMPLSEVETSLWQ